MNLQTGLSQWEIPASDDYSTKQASSSQEMVAQTDTKPQCTDSELTTSKEDFDRYSHTLRGIPRIVAAEQAGARDDRLTKGKKKSSFFDKWRRKSGGFV